MGSIELEGGVNEVSKTRFLVSLIWVFFCGYPVFLFSGCLCFKISDPLFRYWFCQVWSVLFFVVGIPPLIYLEMRQALSKRRRNFIFACSAIGFYFGGTLFFLTLSGFFGLVGLGHLLLNFAPPFFLAYFFMGSWALFAIWFLIVNNKYSEAGVLSKEYAYVSVLVEIAVCLFWGHIMMNPG